MNKKSFISILLTLFLIGVLTACGQENPTPQPQDPSGKAAVDSVSPQPSQTPSEPDEPAAATVVMPEPFPGVPASFEVHAGDGEYFYLYNDDFILKRYNVDQVEFLKSSYELYGSVVQYNAMFFEDGQLVKGMVKRVFETEDAAARYADQSSSKIVVGNVVYDKNPMFDSWGKEMHLELVGEYAEEAVKGEIFISKPVEIDQD